MLVIAGPASAQPTAPRLASTQTTASVSPADVSPPTGSVLEPGEFYTDSQLGSTGGWRVVGQGDGQTTTWTIDFDENAARACGGGRSVSMIGIIRRDGQGPFGGHVLAARLYDFDNTKGYFPFMNLSGFELLTCFRMVNPNLPDGTAFIITTDRVEQFWPAGTGAADGHFDLVTNSNGLGYMVGEYLPGKGWLPPAPIGGQGFEPSVLRLPNGGLRIFVEGQSVPTLYTADISADRHFLGWHRVGGGLASSPYPILMPDGQVSVFVIGTNGLLYQGLFAADGRFRDWVRIGAPEDERLVGEPTAASTGGGNVTIAVTDDDAEIHTRDYVRGHGWGPWTRLPGSTSFAQEGLAAVSPGGGVVDLYWKGTTTETFNHVLTKRKSKGKWGGTTDLGGRVGYLFASYRAGRTDLWAQTTSPTTQSMWQRTNVLGTWRSWHRLPYPD